MEKRTFAFLGIFAVLLLSFGFAIATTSGVLDISALSNPTSVAEDAGTFTFTFDITYTGTSSDVTISFDDSTSNIGTLSIPNATGMDQDDTETIIGTVSDFASLGGQSLTVYINATKGSSRDDETNFTVSITDVTTPPMGDFCQNGEQGDLEIADIEFNNMGEGEDDNWFLLDEIEIEVEVENTHNTENIKDVLVEVKILDDNGEDVTKDFDFDDEEIDLGTIKDDESEIATFRISEIPADLEDGNYKVYIKAYSEDDENTQCASESSDLSHDAYEAVDITREDDPAVIVKGEFITIPASCGDTNVQLPLNIYNLGSDKEEKVMVTLQSNELGINEKIIIDNLRSGKRREIIFFFDVPADLTKDLYVIDIITHYDYDDDEDEFLENSYDENSYDDLDKDFSAKLEILSCRGPNPTVSADLESVAEIGTELVVKTMITNNGQDSDFVISASGFESWANLVSITPQTASIEKGEFTEVIVTLMPTATGTQTFKINTIVGGESYDQSVSVNIAEEPGILKGVDNMTLYLIIGIVALLVIIALVLIVKVSKKSKPQF